MLTPPGSPVAGDTADVTTGTPAVSRLPVVLSKRADFLKAAKGLRQGTAGFHLQARPRTPQEPAKGIRIGYTCSKKVGNAVARNRAKRRLREIARLILPEAGLDGWDYVLVGRADVTATLDFMTMQSDLKQAMARVHKVSLHPGDDQHTLARAAIPGAVRADTAQVNIPRPQSES